MNIPFERGNRECFVLCVPSGKMQKGILSLNTSTDLFMISCPEIDWLVKRVQEIEQNSLLNLSSCSRIIAKDYSYCTYSIMKDEYVETYMQKLQDYERRID